MMMIILHTMSTSGNISSTTLPVGKKIMDMIMTVILMIMMQMVKMMMTQIFLSRRKDDDDKDDDDIDDDDCTDYVDLWQYLNNHSPPLAARSSVKPPPPQRCVHHKKGQLLGKQGKTKHSTNKAMKRLAVEKESKPKKEASVKSPPSCKNSEFTFLYFNQYLQW